MISHMVTWCHVASHDVTWSRGITWCHMVTWHHMASHDLIWSHGITWSHMVTWCHVTSFKPISLHLTWQKSEHFSETAKNPFSLEHRNRRLCFMKSAFWEGQTHKNKGSRRSINSRLQSHTEAVFFLQKEPGSEDKSHERKKVCTQLTVSYSAFPPRATQKKFSGSEPSWITTLEYVGCEGTKVIHWQTQTFKIIPL